jgi:hypothetical protein
MDTPDTSLVLGIELDLQRHYKAGWFVLRYGHEFLFDKLWQEMEVRELDYEGKEFYVAPSKDYFEEMQHDIAMIPETCRCAGHSQLEGSEVLHDREAFGIDRKNKETGRRSTCKELVNSKQRKPEMTKSPSNGDRVTGKTIRDNLKRELAEITAIIRRYNAAKDKLQETLDALEGLS